MRHAAVVAVILLAARSGHSEPEPEECTDVKVGSPAEKATLCTFEEDTSGGTEDVPVYRAQIRTKLRVVRAKKMVTLLDVVTTVSLLDKPRPDFPDLLDLVLEIERDGKSIRLRDAKPGACADALARFDGSSSEPWDRFDHALVSRACARRGRWKWTGSGFVRVPPVSRRSP